MTEEVRLLLNSLSAALLESVFLLIALPVAVGFLISFVLAVLQVQDSSISAITKLLLGCFSCWIFGGRLIQELIVIFRQSLEVVAKIAWNFQG